MLVGSVMRIFSCFVLELCYALFGHIDLGLPSLIDA